MERDEPVFLILYPQWFAATGTQIMYILGKVWNFVKKLAIPSRFHKNINLWRHKISFGTSKLETSELHEVVSILFEGEHTGWMVGSDLRETISNLEHPLRWPIDEGNSFMAVKLKSKKNKDFIFSAIVEKFSKLTTSRNI